MNIFGKFIYFFWLIQIYVIWNFIFWQKCIEKCFDKDNLHKGFFLSGWFRCRILEMKMTTCRRDCWKTLVLIYGLSTSTCSYFFIFDKDALLSVFLNAIFIILLILLFERFSILSIWFSVCFFIISYSFVASGRLLIVGCSCTIELL